MQVFLLSMIDTSCTIQVSSPYDYEKDKLGKMRAVPGEISEELATIFRGVMRSGLDAL